MTKVLIDIRFNERQRYTTIEEFESTEEATTAVAALRKSAHNGGALAGASVSVVHLNPTTKENK